MLNFLNKNNEPDLKQGQLMLDRKKKLLIMGQKHMDLLEETSSPNLGSPVVEPLTSTSNEENSILALENEFNNTLVQYTTAYNVLMNELITNADNKSVKKYAGKNVRLGQNIYYVNNYGVTHGYSNAAWAGKPSSCSKIYVDISENEFNDLLHGPNIGIGQACDIAGYNIENKDTSERSWVDIKGVKHPYSNDVWENRSPSCQSAVKSLKTSAYLNIPTDSSSPPITADFYCNKLNVEPNKLKELASLNDRLLDLAKELLKDTQNLATTDSNLKVKLRDLGKKVSTQMSNLEQDKKEFANTLHNTNGKQLTGDAYNSNVNGIKQSSEYKLSSNYLQYVGWLILTIILILYTSYSFSSTSTSMVSNIIVLLIAAFILYKVASLVKDKIYNLF
tara:strand:+ start:1417 stop:2589 length:1173 start_codon:yes stop_codon:yes gene_type:complete